MKGQRGLVVGKLSARKVQTAKPGKYGDGGGLWFTKLATGAAFWSFRYRLNDRSREMGLGPEHTVTLAEAREAARDARRLVRSGIDPITHRDAAKAEQVGMSFADVSELYLSAHQETWKNPKHRSQWRNTLRDYVLPRLGSRGVNTIDTGDIMAVIEPIWREKPETASRVRGRIETVLDYATARHWRAGLNPARWQGHLDQLLPERSKVAKVIHHAALPWRDLPAFVADLSKQDGMGAAALRLTILCATRTSETVGATWSEIDLAGRLWVLPAERMKAGREHRVPLSDAAMAILGDMAAHRRKDTDPVFMGPGRKKLSTAAMSATLRRMGRTDITVHGFRSTFRDWASEATSYDRAIAEMALAHTIGDKVEAAYRRGDLIEKRTRLMNDWAAYCSGIAPASGEVVHIGERRA